MRWNVLTSNSLYAVSVESMGNSGAGTGAANRGLVGQSLVSATAST